jgi:hypothetical protein
MPDPSENADVLAHYRTRQAELGADERAALTRRNWMRLALLLCFASLCLLAQHALYGTAPWWNVFVAAAAFVLLIIVYAGLSSRLNRIQRLLVHQQRNLLRATGAEPQSGLTGDEFRTRTHLYDRDLDILGLNSIFGMLATVRTGIGQRGLARFLLNPASQSEAQARQQAIRELTPHTGLREQIALLGMTRFEQVSVTALDTWLDEPAPTFHPAIRISLALTTVTLIALLLAGFLHYATWSTLFPNLLAALALHTAIALKARARVMPILGAPKIGNQMRMFSDGLALLRKQTFTSPRLLALQKSTREPADAIATMDRVQSEFVVIEQRSKEWYYVLSLLFAAGTHAAISIANWKRANAAAMKFWLDTWGEFEALNALATYAFEHPGNIYPEVLPDDAPATFEIAGLRHPLLPHCVPNDVELNSITRFYLISGSNMAGKSTLLRAIGVGAVLALAGAPIPAIDGRLSPFLVCASLALTDSLADGKSKFLAEVERLHAIMDEASPEAEIASRQPVLFLIDEIFSGTNSLDRRTAAEAILRALVAAGAVGALSTHDLALTELATPEQHGLNVHMASPDPHDPLAFDYILKPGVNRSSNALAILRLIGLPT